MSFNIVNIGVDFISQNKDNIAFVFDGNQDPSILERMLYFGRWINTMNTKDNVTFYVLDKKFFNLFTLKENESKTITCMLKDELVSPYLSKGFIEYIGASISDERHTLFYSAVERICDDACQESPYTSEIYGSKEIIDKDCYIKYLNELEKSTNQKCFFNGYYSYDGVEFDVLKNELGNTEDISEVLKFISNESGFPDISIDGVSAIKIDNGLEKLLVDVYYNLPMVYPNHDLASMDVLGEEFKLSIRDFSNMLTKECGKLIQAFKVPDLNNVHHLKDISCATPIVVVFEKFILIFFGVSYE